MQTMSHMSTSSAKAKPCCSVAPSVRAWCTALSAPKSSAADTANSPSSLPRSGSDEDQPSAGGSSHAWRAGKSSDGGGARLTRQNLARACRGNARFAASRDWRRPMANVRSEMVELTVEGTEMPTFVAYPEASGPRPAVLVFQEIFGVNAHIKDVATRVAMQGY